MSTSSPYMFYFAALWVWLTLLPTMILNSEKRDKPLGIRDYAGWGLWITGFCLEVMADYQKTVFKADPDNAVCLWLFWYIFTTVRNSETFPCFKAVVDLPMV